MEKYVVIVGGVLSGIGKGVATASIGKILQEYGYNTTAIKIDPYINYDAGTLRPTEHGEVFVTYDGGEIDQDLGTYERFIGCDISKRHNITTGQIYKAVIEKERKGEYLGKTVQFIPHIIDEIKSRIREISKNYEITLVEVGGTVGDYENIPFLFAIKSIEKDIGKENVVYVLITYLPVPHHIHEMKTKPTQQAIKALQENGIIPDIILCRGKEPLDEIRRSKIETYANIKKEFVISAPDIDILYEVPINFEKENLGEKILEKLNLKKKKEPNWIEWINELEKLKNSEEEVTIGIVGKYIDTGNFVLTDSYLSINEAIVHACAKLGVKYKIEWINAKELEKCGDNLIKSCDGIIVPGGFGIEGMEGKINAIKYARENNVPFLGLCLGMQLAVVEFARNCANMEGANSTEIDKNTKYPVVDILPSQKKLIEKKKYGATMRLGAYAAYLKKDSLVYKLYKEENRIFNTKEIKNISKERLGEKIGEEFVIERHRHRYEINFKYIEKLEKYGLVFSGLHKTKKGELLAEFIEIPNHIFFIATQAHPEFSSKFTNPHPLFLGFIKAILKQKYKNNK